MFISNVGMMKDYATWCAHNLVVLRESNRWRKGCGDLRCGHDRGVRNVTYSWSCILSEMNWRRMGWVDLHCGHGQGVYNMTCSSSCSTKRTKSMKEGMRWSPMWAWFGEYATWRDHNLVVLSETNRRRKGCVDLHCGPDRGVCNVLCWCLSSTKQNESMKEGMCWSPMRAWSRSMQCDMLMIK
jgi:hypothetical protein